MKSAEGLYQPTRSWDLGINSGFLTFIMKLFFKRTNRNFKEIYHRVNRPKYTLELRLGGPQSRSVEEKNLALAGNRIPSVQAVAHRYTGP